MIISDKIRLYRAKAELSHEALAEMLLVDAEAVRLWEEGRAFPDNSQLAKLNEILGIYDNENPDNSPVATEKSPCANEVFTFKYSDEDLFEVNKVTTRNIFKRFLLLSAFLLAFLILFIINNSSEFEIGFTAGMLIMTAIILLMFRKINKNSWKENLKYISEQTYEYNVYDDHIIVNIHKDAESFSRTKILFSDVTLVQDLGRFFTIVYANKVYVIRKADHKQESVLYNFLENHPKKKTLKRGKIKYRAPKNEKAGTAGIKKLMTISRVLFWASVISFFAFAGCVSHLSSINGMDFENMWIGFLFLPISVASAIIAIILKAKGQKTMVRIIFSIIIAFYLSAFGSTSFMEKTLYNESDDTLVLMAEKYIETDIPEYKKIKTVDMVGFDPEGTNENITYTESEVFFEKDKVEDFENHLANNENWLSEVPTNLKGMMSQYYRFVTYDYAMIYNMSSKEANTLPDEAGEYQCLNILYDVDQNKMTIIEYQLTYKE